MSLPALDRNEYPVSSIGIETEPQGVIVKNTLWVVQLGYSRIIVKEYEGQLFVIDSVLVKNYKVTPALKSDLTVDPNRFWVWVVDLLDVLSLYEIEPYVDAAPSITYSKVGISSSVDTADAYVTAGEAIRVITLSTSSELSSALYYNIRSTDPPIIESLTWSGSRLSEFSSYVNQDRTGLDITYLDVASPPNVYVESYTVGIPPNLSATQVGSTNEVSVSWDGVVNADLYTIDRDTNPSFSSPVSISTSLTSYQDTVSTTGTYYYRVRAINTSLLLQSPWSGTEEVTIALTAEFYGVPLSIDVGDIVSFFDQSTPTGVILSWEWDFGDGGTSTLQNPDHVYTTSGSYAVTLTVYNGLDSDMEIKPLYITVAASGIADFSADPTQGDANLFVQFTDLSIGDPISWDWDFGDGSPHATTKNPVHVYTIAGLHDVTLSISDGINPSTVTKVDYIEVEMVADFLIQNASGAADLIVQFTDITLGTPTSWYWDFGDGQHSTEQNPSHIYIYPGHYTVSLTAYNAEKTDTEIKTDVISVYTHADFMGSPRTGYSTLITQFVDKSTGFPTSWYWDFGDGSFSTEQNPLHHYTTPGTYTVILGVSSAFNSDTEIKEGYIVIDGTATPDIAPEPDMLAYLTGNVDAYRDITGIRIRYKKKDGTS